jgi:FkbM family methyltransferase
MLNSKPLHVKNRRWRSALPKRFAHPKTCGAAVTASWVVCVLVLASRRATHDGSTREASIGLGRRGGAAATMKIESGPACKDLRVGWHLPAKAAALPHACADLPVDAVRIDNPEFSICARTKHNLVDNHIKGTKGYWPDCGDILKLLEGAGDDDDGAASANLHFEKQKSKGLVVDVGANIGACAIWMAARGYDVIAFEPKPVHIAMLRATAALRPEIGRRITLHEMGLSDEPTAGAVLVSEDSNSGNSWIFKPTQAAASSVLGIGGAPGATVSSDAGVSLGRLEDYCAQTIDVLKVDTQGFEGHVFRGAVGLMRKGHIKRIRFEYWPFALRKHGSDPVEVLTFLNQEGYALFEKGEKLEPAQFRALTDHLCEDNGEPGCAYRFTDVTGVWEGAPRGA